MSKWLHLELAGLSADVSMVTSPTLLKVHVGQASFDLPACSEPCLRPYKVDVQVAVNTPRVHTVRSQDRETEVLRPSVGGVPHVHATAFEPLTIMLRAQRSLQNMFELLVEHNGGTGHIVSRGTWIGKLRLPDLRSLSRYEWRAFPSDCLLTLQIYFVYLRSP